MERTGKAKGPASYFPSIETKYGHSVEHWLGLLREAGVRKHMELVALLKSEHGMGHGHANALVAYHLARRSSGFPMSDGQVRFRPDGAAAGS